MVRLSLLGGDRLADDIPVAARPDAPRDHDRRGVGLVLGPHLLEELHRAPVELYEPVGRVAESLRPVLVRPPCGGLEHDAEAVLPRDADVRLEVAPQRLLAPVAGQQVVRGKVRQVVTLVEDQRRLDAAVRQKRRVT